MEDKIGLALGICIAIIAFGILIYNTWLHRKNIKEPPMSSTEYIEKYLKQKKS